MRIQHHSTLAACVIFVATLFRMRLAAAPSNVPCVSPTIWHPQHRNTAPFQCQSKPTKETKHAASKKSFHRLKPRRIIENKYVADRSVRHKTLAPSNSWETELSSSMIYVQTSAADLSYPCAVWCSKRVRTHQVAKCVLSICLKC